MAFDGSSYDALLARPGSRMLRPATFLQALEFYPLFILRLRQNVLRISVPAAVEGPGIVLANNPSVPPERWAMLLSDFEKCKRVAGLVSVPLFSTDTQEVLLSRISAQVAVEFS